MVRLFQLLRANEALDNELEKIAQSLKTGDHSDASRTSSRFKELLIRMEENWREIDRMLGESAGPPWRHRIAELQEILGEQGLTRED
jgi:hypothetical protein